MAMPKFVNCYQQVDLILAYRDRNFSHKLSHKHTFWELILFESGDGEHVINSARHPFKKGSIALLSPSEMHHITNEDGNFCDTTKVKFNDAVWRDHLKDVCQFEHFPVVALLSNEDFEKARRIMDLLCEETNKPLKTEDMALSLQLAASLLILIQRNLPGAVKKDSNKTTTILQYIQEHFCEPITVTNVANALNYSPKYFSRMFVNELGVPFNEYIKNLRLDYAYHLIKYSQLPISEICCRTGFSTPSHFSKCFKEQYGIAPSHLRGNSEFLD